MSPRRLIIGSIVAWLALLFAVSGVGVGLGTPAQADPASVLVVHTVPPTPGARISAEGVIAVADEHGVAVLPVRNWDLINRRFHVLDTRVSKTRKVVLDRMLGTPYAARGGRPFYIGLRSERLVSWSFTDRGGQEIPKERISLMELRSNTGELASLTGEDLLRPRWLASGRTQQTPKGLANKDLYWSISRVVVDGAEVVNRGQQVFYPEEGQDWQISLLFYRVTIDGRDLLFGGTAGSGVELVQPDGSVVKQSFDDHGVALFPSLPRGSYQVRVIGAGASYTRPLSISRDQEVSIEVISPLDVGVVLAAGVLVAVSLVVVGRRRQISALLARVPRWGAATTVLVVFVVLLGMAAVGTPAPASAAGSPAVAGAVVAAERDEAHVPAYAYFYIWYQPTTWLRAKSDYPLLGHYSSDDAVVMRAQVRMALAAGLDGFIVSWKHTDTLDRRLELLVRIAREEGLRLALVYQGLDHERNHLPVGTVTRDLRWFAGRYAANPVFGQFGAPVVALTGTDAFTLPDLGRIAAAAHGLRLVGTAKDPAAYTRIAGVVAGDAYYWSSAHPGPGWYTDKLAAMGDVVHADGGLWLAPAAPGFDARLVGGEQVIPRADGETLRAAVAAAEASRPDVLSVISWNEYSENSQIEPSEVNGTVSLETLADLLGGSVWLPAGTHPAKADRDRSGVTGWGALVLIVLFLGALNLAVAVRRPQRDDPSVGDPSVGDARDDNTAGDRRSGVVR